MTRASAPMLRGFVLFGCSGRNESGLPAIDSSSVVRGSDELRGENVPDRAWRAARSLRGLVYDTHRYLAGTAERPGFLPTGWRHSGAANAQRAILRTRNELAGHSPDGNRCSSVAVGGQFLTSVTRWVAGYE